MQAEKSEIHTVFLAFSSFFLKQNLPLSALVDLIRASLKQYAELQEQATDFDPVELYEARQAIRPKQEQLAAKKVQDAYGEKYDLLRMYDSKRAISLLMNEPAEEQVARKLQRMRQQPQKLPQRKHKHYEQER